MDWLIIGIGIILVLWGCIRAWIHEKSASILIIGLIVTLIGYVMPSVFL